MTTAATIAHTVEAPLDGLQPSAAWRLFIVSVATLYLEIVLIRWIGTEVRIFAYFQNLTLIACFLGFGLGCFSSKERGSLLSSLIPISVLIVLVDLPSEAWHNLLNGMSAALTLKPDAELWGYAFLRNLSTLDWWRFTAFSVAVLWLFLLLTVNSMIPLGRWVGHYLETATDAVTAYSVNLGGSIVGLWLLAVLAHFWLPPWCWFAVAFGLILLSQPIQWKTALLGCVLFAVAFFFLKAASSDRIHWSPYQKLQVIPIAGDQQYLIKVNESEYMTVANVTPEVLAQHPEVRNNYLNSSYDSPFRFAGQLNRVLVVGAGAGNDIAAALRHGAKHVDAVEIDPLIQTLGRQLHPEHPYDSTRVQVYINDARNFLRHPHEPYDAIVMGLLDSHTEFSGYSNMRVDNYVYTEESFRDAKRLLAPSGVLILKFEVRKPWDWIGQRFYAMLDGIFGHPPVTYFSPRTGLMNGLSQGSVFIESNSPELWEKASQPDNAAFLRAYPPVYPALLAGAPPPTTDDWPYVYHQSHSIPRTYLTVSVLLLLMTLLRVWNFFRPGEPSTWHFFLLGAGFLLMETQLVSRLALYFGTTWVVNSIAITCILIVLLLANVYVKRRRPVNLKPYYIWLCAGLFASYIIPWNRISGPAAVVGLLLCVAYSVPVFFAGVIFTESFRRSEERSYAFGANILGAVAGGLAQNLSFIIGLKALLLLAIVVYAAAAILQSRRALSLGATA